MSDPSAEGGLVRECPRSFAFVLQGSSLRRHSQQSILHQGCNIHGPASFFACPTSCTQVSVEMDMSKPDLAAALKDIRAQYENLSARNQAQAEEWYRSKFASVTEVAARNQDAIKHSKEELSEYRRQVQARTLEIEALRGHNEALERQIAEMEDRHNSELGDMQVSR